MRRHRLAERLFTDVLEIRESTIHGHACTLEHAIPEEVEEAICTLLGHPKECPHGKPIPPGRCCKIHRKVVETIVVSLAEMEEGERGRIAYLLTRKLPRMHRLMSLGIVPGTEVEVLQKTP